MISTGSLKLDLALQTGGYLPGCIVEINGPISSGKTLLAQHAVAEAQVQGGLCAWIDADSTFCANQACHMGVDPHRLYYCPSSNSEQAFGTLDILVKSGAFSLIVLDSFQALVPIAEEHGLRSPTPEERNYDLLSKVLPSLSQTILKTGTTVIFTQTTDKRKSVVYHQLSKQMGRLSLLIYASVRMHLTPIQLISRDGELIGVRIEAQIVKNTFAPFLYTTVFDIINGKGINKTGEVFSLGIFHQVILSQAGGFYFQKTHLGKNPADILYSLDHNKAVREEIEQELRRTLMPEFLKP